MSIDIGSIATSLSAQRYLGTHTADARRSLERLSSGLRINHASDDAAGLAISTALFSNAQLCVQSIRNVNDAIAITSVASDAIVSQVQILERMLELAEQSANGTYRYKQRLALNNEYSALMGEFQRIGSTTSFNGIDLLKSSTGQQPIVIQNGIDSSQNSQVTLNVQDQSSLNGVIAYNGDINGDGSINAQDNTLANQFNASFGTYSGNIITVDSLNDFYGGAILHSTIQDSSGTTRDVYTAVNGIPNYLVSGPPTLHQFVADADGNLTHLSDDTPNLGGSFTSSLTFSGGATGSITFDLSNVTLSPNDIGITPPVRPTALAVTGVESQSRARTAMKTLRNKVDEADQLLSSFGSFQSRLGYSVANLSTINENYRAAGSQIRDADVAEEAAASIEAGILQKAAASVLAQAAQSPRLALVLLG